MPSSASDLHNLRSMSYTPDIKSMRLYALLLAVSNADTLYPRGSEAQIRLIEELAQDARYVMSLFKPTAKVGEL